MQSRSGPATDERKSACLHQPIVFKSERIQLCGVDQINIHYRRTYHRIQQRSMQPWRTVGSGVECGSNRNQFLYLPRIDFEYFISRKSPERTVASPGCHDGWIRQQVIYQWSAGEVKPRSEPGGELYRLLSDGWIESE